MFAQNLFLIWICMAFGDNMQVLKFQSFLLVAVVGWLALPPLIAQKETASLSGLVQDPSGLPVSSASLSVKSLETGFKWETESNTSGYYVFPYLKPGQYQIRINKESFKGVTSTFRAQINQAIRMDFQLELGEISEQVNVSAPEDLLQVENMTVGGFVDQRSLETLPGRSLSTILGMSPGVTDLSLQGYTANGLTALQPGRGALAQNLNIGGYRQTGNYYILDGTTNTDGHINAYVNAPAVESLQELRLQTSSHSTDFGNVVGGGVNLATRSGTNQLRWEMYDYLVNDAFNARPYNFNEDQGVLPKPPLRQNQFGASIGGPLRLPGFNPKTARSFFFVHYEGLESRSRSQNVASIPTENARHGDLSDYGVTIYDPNALAQGVRRPFPDNRIPETALDPVAVRLLAMTPMPTIPNQIINNYVANQLSRIHDHQGNVRIDHQFSENDFLSGAYHLSDEKINQDGIFGAITGITTTVRAQNLSLNHTHTFNPETLNNFKFGFNRLKAIDAIYSGGTPNIISQLGINGISTDPANNGFPEFRLGFLQIPSDDTNRPTTLRDNTFQLIDTLTAIQGRHQWKFGAEYRRFEDNFLLSNYSRGSFRYNGVFTSGPDPINPTANSGLALADFLLGYPQEAVRTVGSPQSYLRRNAYSLFAEDTIRMTQKLTLTLGLRYDYTSPFNDLRNNLYNLDFSNLPAPPRLIHLGVDSSSLPQNGVRSNTKNFGPRVGVAFQFSPKTVVRTGYGIFYVQEVGALFYGMVRNGVNTEFHDSPVLQPSLTTANSFSSAESSLPSYSYIDPNSSTPYVQQWNLGIQRELTSRLTIEAVYVGSKGTHLFRYRNWNNAYHVETGENLPPRPGDLQQLRTFPSLGPILEQETSSSSIYHALLVRLQRSFSANLSFINSFTWSKSIDDSDVPLQDLYQSPGPQDERNLKLERGLSAFDVRKRFTSGIVYTLPFGTGQRYSGHGGLSRWIGPWQIATSLVMQDGYPQDLRGFITMSTIGGSLQRPNIVPGKSLVLSEDVRRNLQPTPELPHPEFLYYDPSAISTPGPYELGNAGRNIAHTPGAVNLNIALFRSVPIREPLELLFRADFLNALNIVNLGIPNPSYEFVGFYGQLVTAGQMRAITLSLKLRF